MTGVEEVLAPSTCEFMDLGMEGAAIVRLWVLTILGKELWLKP